MSASFGAPDLELWSSPLPDLLRRVTGFEPEPNENHVRLDEHLGVQSMQRLAIADLGGSVIVALWPAELAAQGRYFYSAGRAQAVLTETSARSWDVTPRPHLAFFNAHPSQRLYMCPEIPPEEYAARWAGPDATMIGRSPHEEMTSILSWLRERGYLDSGDDAAVVRFVKTLGRRKVDVRPGLMLSRKWERRGKDVNDLAAPIRADANAILAAAGEANRLHAR